MLAFMAFYLDVSLFTGFFSLLAFMTRVKNKTRKQKFLCVEPSPPLLSGALSVSTQNEKLWAYAQYLYDSLGQRIRLSELGTYQNKTFTYDVLMLFRQATIYEINERNRTCKKKALKDVFQPWAVPKDASLLGQVVLGSSSGPGEGLLVNTWMGDLPQKNGKFMSTVTEFGCIPVSTVYHTDQFGWMVTSFFNNVIGISDPSRLNPPNFCTDAQPLLGNIMLQDQHSCDVNVKLKTTYFILSASPPLLTGSFSVSTQNEKLMGFAKYSYDALRKRIHLREVGSYNNKTFHIDLLLLYKEGVMYKINYKNRTCCKKPLSVDFHPLEIPQSASLLGQVVLGSSSGPGQGVLVNTWAGELKLKEGTAKYMSTVTEFGCIPVSTLYHSEKSGWVVVSFFNGVIGLVDPQHLIPPGFCKDAQLESGEESITFFNLF
ncbi:Ependymin [Nibea albiflora]|uniref:Ependymin n=1 Tax=Nibea albiflora TaxID=240163 RepID=A0ACB7EWI1_NIBAL|nr:Ependymin [Nibea albiflora]